MRSSEQVHPLFKRNFLVPHSTDSSAKCLELAMVNASGEILIPYQCARTQDQISFVVRLSCTYCPGLVISVLQAPNLTALVRIIFLPTKKSTT